MNPALQRLLAEAQDFIQRSSVFRFLRNYHGIMITQDIQNLFEAADGYTYGTARVGNFIVSAHGPSSTVYLLAWIPTDDVHIRSRDRFLWDVLDVRALVPKLKLYQTWYYFVSNLPALEELPAMHTFQYGRMLWPREQPPFERNSSPPPRQPRPPTPEWIRQARREAAEAPSDEMSDELPGPDDDDDGEWIRNEQYTQTPDWMDFYDEADDEDDDEKPSQPKRPREKSLSWDEFSLDGLPSN